MPNTIGDKYVALELDIVAVSELIPESEKNSHKNLMSFFIILGFTIMMVLDVALG